MFICYLMYIGRNIFKSASIRNCKIPVHMFKGHRVNLMGNIAMPLLERPDPLSFYSLATSRRMRDDSHMRPCSSIEGMEAHVICIRTMPQSYIRYRHPQHPHPTPLIKVHADLLTST